MRTLVILGFVVYVISTLCRYCILQGDSSRDCKKLPILSVCVPENRRIKCFGGCATHALSRQSYSGWISIDYSWALVPLGHAEVPFSPDSLPPAFKLDDSTVGGSMSKPLQPRRRPGRSGTSGKTATGLPSRSSEDPWLSALRHGIEIRPSLMSCGLLHIIWGSHLNSIMDIYLDFESDRFNYRCTGTRRDASCDEHFSLSDAQAGSSSQVSLCSSLDTMSTGLFNVMWRNRAWRSSFATWQGKPH
ncbi:hypothetical protein BDR03DRAFT_974185 [Suillus americanus]|nr:hypothetical protein BDR03DRAFT_974185 [Suillus americanus]